MSFGLNASSWTDERVALLKKLWADGMSAKQITREMGGFDHCQDGGRSAVLGKVHSLRLAKRVKAYTPRAAQIAEGRKASTERRKLVQQSAPASPMSAAKGAVANPVGRGLRERIDAKIAAATRPDVDELVHATDLPDEKIDTAVSFFARTPEQCAHPLGNPQDLATFRFCGGPREGREPYCSKHCRMNYAPARSAPNISAAVREQRRRHASRLAHNHR